MRRYRRLDVGCKKSTDRGPGEGADAGSRQHVWHKEGRTFENGAQNVRAKASDITPGRPPAGGGRVPDLATEGIVPIVRTQFERLKPTAGGGLDLVFLLIKSARSS